MKSLAELFQFQYGAIESWGLIWQKIYFFDFNSSMVRLKVLPVRRKIAFNLFQFQYGAIESWHSTLVFCLLLLISIPVWCD